MPEIKNMYDGHPSIKSIKLIKSITSMAVITRRVLSIDFYRLIDTIDNVYALVIDLSNGFPISIAQTAFYPGP